MPSDNPHYPPVDMESLVRAAAAEIAAMAEGEQREWALRGLASMLVAQPEAHRNLALQLCPGLASADPIPDTYLGSDEQQIANRLTPLELEAVDRAILEHCTTSWRQLARVLGPALVALQDQFSEVLLPVCVQRAQALAAAGRLLARGDARFMRLGEVRLPENTAG
jgi:hypothetical protein